MKILKRYKNDEHLYSRIFEENKSKYKNIEEEDSNKQMKKTLDGKKAGLQDAKALREETEAYKKREAEHFSKVFKQILYSTIYYYIYIIVYYILCYYILLFLIYYKNLQNCIFFSLVKKLQELVKQ